MTKEGKHTIEDKIKHHINNRKLYEDFYVLDIIKDLPSDQTRKIIDKLKQVHLDNVSYFMNKKSKFIKNVMMMMKPTL